MSEKGLADVSAESLLLFFGGSKNIVIERLIPLAVFGIQYAVEG